MSNNKTGGKVTDLATKVGNVPIEYTSDSSKVKYADGAEQVLFNIFSSSNPKKKTAEVLSNKPSWPMVYHLSNKRSSLIDWYKFKKGAKILEVGAGCGAITEALVQKSIQVTALEIDPIRARVNAERNKKATNLKVVVGNIEDFKPEHKFDYIVCVGVLEYSGKYITSEDPYAAFATKMKSFLNSEGVCLIAIENKLGLKYLAGASEDHTGVMFDSTNNYPNSSGTQTFSKKELGKILENAGFHNQYFYYPHPDYKLPHVVFSDAMYPGKAVNFPLGLLPTPTPEPRRYLFSEQALAITLEHEDVFPSFANSFLAEVSEKGKVGNEVLGYVGQNDRKDQFRIGTYFLRDSDEKIVVQKQAQTSEANNHILQMIATSNLLKKLGIKHLEPRLNSKSKDSTVAEPLASIAYPLVSGQTLERTLLEALLNNKLELAKKMVASVFSIIDQLPSSKINPSKNKGFVDIFGNHYDKEVECVKPGIIDLNLDNFIVSDNKKLTLFDYEWVFDFYVPKEFLKARLLISFFGPKYSDILRRNYKKLQLNEMFNGIVIPKTIQNIASIPNAGYKKAYLSDVSFQNYVSRIPITQEAPSNLSKNQNIVNSYESFPLYLEGLEKSREELNNLKPVVEHLNKVLAEYQERLQRYDNYLPIKAYRNVKKRLR